MFLQSTLVWAAVIFLAVILDVWLILWARQKWRVDETGPQVRLWGVYSPVLTWLKYRFLTQVTGRALDQVKVRAWGAALVELSVIGVWGIWLGRRYLNFNELIWPLGNEFGSHVQTHYLWVRMLQCGWCALWDGNTAGGFPAFADTLAASLHPLIAATTLLFGVLNGAKVTVVVLLMLAGFAQWWLAKELGLGRVARLWSALTAAAAGAFASRMELAQISLLGSTIMSGMCFAPALAVAKGHNPRAVVLLGVCLASAALSGQGYMQAALAFTVPAGLFLLLDDQFKLRSVWRDYALALGLGLLLAAYFLIPLVHFLPNYVKDLDPAFSMGQPLEYLPLNLVIRDRDFLNTPLLSKIEFPVMTTLYIGWVPVLLAALPLRLARREDHRPLLFLTASFGITLLTASAVLLRWLVPVFPEVAGLRSAPALGGLMVFPVLGLAAYGLDKLLRASWPSLLVRWEGHGGAVTWSSRRSGCSSFRWWSV